MDITEALLTLDPENDEHWTSNRLPNVKIIAGLVGNEGLKRADINAVDPEFIRREKSSNDISELNNSSIDEIKPMDPEASLAAGLSEKQAKMGVLTKKISDLGKLQKILGREIGQLAGQLDKLRSNRKSTDAQHYLATQAKLREKKSERLKAIDPVAIKEILRSVAKAPIDLAMNTRKPSRGSQRLNKSMIN